jgi:hypothetical protein
MHRFGRGPVRNDALIGVSEQHSSGTLPDRGVFEVEAVGVEPIRLAGHGHGDDFAPPSVATGLRRLVAANRSLDRHGANA